MALPIRLLTVLWALVAGAPAHAAVVLQNALWTVSVDPATLALVATPSGQAPVQVSSGVAPRAVQQLDQRVPGQLRWQWDDGAYQVSTRLDGHDLLIQVHARAPGTLALLRQPAAAMGRGLILPLAEGAYVPAGHAQWRDFLLQGFEQFNTTQDISLPLWGTDHGAVSFHWLLLNPFDNQAGFTADGQGLAMTLSHQFTALSPATPMTLMLHLGAGQPLAGAQRYRQWRLHSGIHEPLADKLSATPHAGRLPGAAHVYLWGSGLLADKDVLDWPAFLGQLAADDTFASRLRSALDAEARALLRKPVLKPTAYQRQALLRAVNETLDNHARAAWQTAEPDMAVLSSRYGELRAEVAAHFGSALDSDPARWGGGVSQATMQTLRASGLQRLWIGLGQGWEGGLWHPEAIASAVDAGFLIAPYDSYETAVPSGGGNASWTTTYLGDAAYRDCAIRNEDGSDVLGFQKTGRYTRPDCVRPLLQARIPALLAAAPFNSWFLDVYATGMVFTSYPPGTPMTQQQNAEGYMASMRWVGDSAGLVLGSEDGNAVTAGGALFAHGMQTPVIGWGDHDMHHNRQSAHYVGPWYPEEQPAVFFKPVPLKQSLRSIHFDPSTRLPLYQAVFHGSVITTHHWLYDSLKLSNVGAENELAQLLYNVPPLYHLSEATLSARLPAMLRQDAFFRPLHARLATQALTGFAWLDDQRQVQETRFEDGTRLRANFSADPVDTDLGVLAAHSISAYLPGEAAPRVYRVTAAAAQ